MAYDKVVDSAVLDAGLTKIADAIRAKDGTADNMEFPDGFASLIESIKAGGGGGNFAWGIVTPAEALDAVVVKHGLNAYPTFAVLCSTFSAAKSLTYPAMCSLMWWDETQTNYKWYTLIFFAPTSSSRMLYNNQSTTYPDKQIGVGYYVCHPSESEISFGKGATDGFPAGVPLLWLATTGVTFV